MRPARRVRGNAFSTCSTGSESHASARAMTLRVAIAGAGGRMGQALIDATLAASDLTLAGALELAGSPMIGMDAGAQLGRSTGVPIVADIDAVAVACDVLI